MLTFAGSRYSAELLSWPSRFDYSSQLKTGAFVAAVPAKCSATCHGPIEEVDKYLSSAADCSCRCTSFSPHARSIDGAANSYHACHVVKTAVI
jgi:hypothetical protein